MILHAQKTPLFFRCLHEKVNMRKEGCIDVVGLQVHGFAQVVPFLLEGFVLGVDLVGPRSAWIGVMFARVPKTYLGKLHLRLHEYLLHLGHILLQCSILVLHL